MADESVMTRGQSAVLLVSLLAVCFLIAGLGGLSTVEGVRDWYPQLDKPPWTPPNWAFGPIWTVLYASMAVAAWDVARRGLDTGRAALAMFAAQLVLNALWSPLFFAWHEVAAALAVLTGMWFCIAACIGLFWPISRLAAGLMIPYLAWVSIAWSLNAWVWWFNA